MAKLLVSVRNAAEAATAIAGGADWIDVKEPAAGSLGMPRPSNVTEVVDCVSGAVPVSTALGELCEHASWDHLSEFRWHGISWAKAGLSGCAERADWPVRLRTLCNNLPNTTSLVAVVYADAAHCHAPEPLEVLEVARQLQLRALLVDTYDKSAGGLFDWFSRDRLGELFEAAHQAEMLAVAAGSLRIAQVPLAIEAGADVIAVRGAACGEGRRDAPVCLRQVRRLQTAITEANLEFS